MDVPNAIASFETAEVTVSWVLLLPSMVPIESLDARVVIGVAPGAAAAGVVSGTSMPSMEISPMIPVRSQGQNSPAFQSRQAEHRAQGAN